MIDQLQQITAKIDLVLDSPQSVRSQVKELNQVKREIALFRKRVNAEIRQVNANAAQTSPDTLSSILFDAAGKRKAAGTARAHQRRQIQYHKRDLNQPLQNLKLYLDELDLHIEELKLIAQQYLNDPQRALELGEEIHPVPPIPNLQPVIPASNWEWVGSIVCLMAAIGSLLQLSLWTWLSSPFWAIAGIALLPPIQPTIRNWFEGRIEIPIPFGILRGIVVGLC